MNLLQFWPGTVAMMLVATITAALVIMVYPIFAMTLYLLPPRAQ